MSAYHFTPLAEEDLTEVVDYITSEAGADRADAFLEDVFEAIERLAEVPAIGHRRHDLAEDASLRFWPVSGFFIVYRSETPDLEVVRFVRGSRDVATMLGDGPGSRT